VGTKSNVLGFSQNIFREIPANNDEEAVDLAKKEELANKVLFKATAYDVNVNREAENAARRLERFERMLEREGMLMPETKR